MSLIDVDHLVLPPAPACTSWCTGHAGDLRDGQVERNGWIASPYAVMKWCKRDLPSVETEEAENIDISVQRFAWIDVTDDAASEQPVSTDRAVVSMDTYTNMTPDQADALADQLREAARLARL